MVYIDAYDNIEHRLFEDLIANCYLLHEVERDFKCTPECYKKKL